MIKSGILNPQLSSLLCRVRHTNTLVVADRGFPFWPQLETIDLSLVDGQPQVLQVLRAILPNFSAGKAWMAEEFLKANQADIQGQFAAELAGITVEYEPHDQFKLRIPRAIGLIRTGDTTQYANMILESA